MISLTKGTKPRILEEKGETWTTRLLENTKNDTVTVADRTRYRHPEIKAALIEETAGKCAYCESKILHIHPGDVEHIFPKSKAIEKSFEWSNLTLACKICNQNKSDKDPTNTAIIDPYKIDPSLHFMFLGAFVLHLGTPEGISSRVLLDLDRPALVERRKERLEKILATLSMVRRLDVPIEARQAILKNAREEDAGRRAEYSAMSKTAIEQFICRLPSELADELAA